MMGFTFKREKLEINGQTLEYDDIFTPVRLGEPIDEKYAVPLFRKTKELFDEAGIKFALVFGTLLGAVREHGHTIKGDYDMDICVWDEEKLRNNLVSMQAKGLKVCRAIEGIIYSFRLDESCYIDIYIVRSMGFFEDFPIGTYCLYLGGMRLPKKFLAEYSEIEFLGEKCLCPANPERLLEFWYGSDWRIPQNKKGNYHARLWTYKQKAKTLVKRIIRMPFKIIRLVLFPSYRRAVINRRKETGSFFYN